MSVIVIRAGLVRAQSGAAIPQGSGTLSVAAPYIFDGTNYWIGFPLRQVTLPDATTFTWINQGTGSITADGHALVLNAPTNSGDSLRIRITPISSNTTVTAAVTITGLGVSFNECGVGFYESATQKLEAISTMYQATNGVFTQARRWTNPTSFSAGTSNSGNISGTNGWGPSNIVWYQVIYNGTTVTYNVSLNGVTWTQLLSESKTAFFTSAPDNFTFYCDEANANGYSISMEVLSWKMQ